MTTDGRTADLLLTAGTPAVQTVAQLGPQLDLLVVGGGILGAWTALEAALRGQRVGLVERGAWASGTSRASSKLIHGGLRYLEHGHFGLVRTALRERARLLRNAPHRVRPLRFLVPVVRGGRLGRVRLGIGLKLYDLLAGNLDGLPRSRGWSAAEVLAGAPFLDPRAVVAGFTYSDAGTDDAALVRDVVAAAQSAGAVCCVDTPVAGLLRAGGRVAGAQLASGAVVRARTTVLAAGAWAFGLAGLPAASLARFTKGIHLELPPLPMAPPFDRVDTALLLTAPQDGRVFFLIPWKGGTLVGTTDTDCAEDPDGLTVGAADVAYLLEAVAANCPGLGWGGGDITASWAGLRTLRGGTASASSLSRDWELRVPEPGLLLPIGGKLTSARAEAVRVVDAA